MFSDSKCHCNGMAPYHVYGPSILIILILFWQLLIRYLFRLTSMYELLFLSVAFFFVWGLHKIIDFFLTYGFSDYNWFVQVRERKSLFIKLLISRLLRKKHLSTVISNNMEPPSNAFSSSTSIMTAFESLSAWSLLRTPQTLLFACQLSAGSRKKRKKLIN